ncbi:hypothetical protein GCM10009716_23420 [Streptomyces sodiiphilus]|uniref:TetR family transcriptional regulator n=1 Tax=Streptomyces sodiiphilus TaxID=226217 RepID=A0ABP5AGX0_9ACTN
MPTEHACLAAAEQAARGIAPVKALLAPPTSRPSAQQGEPVPVVIRAFLEPTPTRPSDYPPPPSEAPPEPVTPAVGATMLLVFLNGLQADLTGQMVDWYAGLPTRIPEALGAPVAAAQGRSPVRPPNEWQAMADLRNSAMDVLTALADRPRKGPHGPGELHWRLALVEDVFAGALRRLAVPPDTSVGCSADLASAAGPLFGIQRTTAPPASRAAPNQHAY